MRRYIYYVKKSSDDTVLPPKSVIVTDKLFRRGSRSPRLGEELEAYLQDDSIDRYIRAILIYLGFVDGRDDQELKRKTQKVIPKKLHQFGL